MGTLVPFLLLGLVQLVGKRIPTPGRERMYFLSASLILLGVLAMRWNVVIGGQLFSKSLRGFTTYKMELAGQEGWLVALALILLPFLILGVLLKYFLPLKHVFTSHEETSPEAAALHAPEEA
jgi:predicted membrane protein